MHRCSHVSLMADYNRWMNENVYAVAATLPPAALVLDRHAFFGSILGTLNHLVAADTIWLQRFATLAAHAVALDAVRRRPAPTGLAQILFADFATLRVQRAELDAIIIAWAGTISPADLDGQLAYANTRGVAAQRNVFSLLMHFFNHQTHHRGQVTTLLSQAGVDVGMTDLLALIPSGHAP